MIARPGTAVQIEEICPVDQLFQADTGCEGWWPWRRLQRKLRIAESNREVRPAFFCAGPCELLDFEFADLLEYLIQGGQRGAVLAVAAGRIMPHVVHELPLGPFELH